MPGPIRNPSEAFQQLEAIMLRQMLQSSGAFRASNSPGAQLRTDLFVETLADAVAKAGGLGIAHMLERQMGGEPAQAKRESTPGSFALPFPNMGGLGGTGAVDSLDDPNSEAPLPEDPAAPSIDDYQIGTTGKSSRIDGGPTATKQPTNSHLDLQNAPHHHPSQVTSTVLPTLVTRALNRYRQRVEDMGAGTPSGAGGREIP